MEETALESGSMYFVVVEKEMYEVDLYEVDSFFEATSLISSHCRKVCIVSDIYVYVRISL